MLSVGRGVHSQISKTTCPNFTKYSVYVKCVGEKLPFLIQQKHRERLGKNWACVLGRVSRVWCTWLIVLLWWVETIYDIIWLPTFKVTVLLLAQVTANNVGDPFSRPTVVMVNKTYITFILKTCTDLNWQPWYFA